MNHTSTSCTNRDLRLEQRGPQEEPIRVKLNSHVSLAASALTSFGEGDEVMRDRILEVLVCLREGLPQDGLQPSEEGHGVQAVEGEAAGERQQTDGGRVDGTGWRVGHHVSIHGAVQRLCRQTDLHPVTSSGASSVTGPDTFHQLTCRPGRQVVVGTGDPDVGHHGGVGPLGAAVCGGAGGGARIQFQRLVGEILAEGPEFLCVEQPGEGAESKTGQRVTGASYL